MNENYLENKFAEENEEDRLYFDLVGFGESKTAAEFLEICNEAGFDKKLKVMSREAEIILNELNEWVYNDENQAGDLLMIIDASDFLEIANGLTKPLRALNDYRFKKLQKELDDLKQSIEDREWEDFHKQ